MELADFAVQAGILIASWLVIFYLSWYVILPKQLKKHTPDIQNAVKGMVMDAFNEFADESFEEITKKPDGPTAVRIQKLVSIGAAAGLGYIHDLIPDSPDKPAPPELNRLMRYMEWHIVRSLAAHFGNMKKALMEGAGNLNEGGFGALSGMLGALGGKSSGGMGDMMNMLQMFQGFMGSNSSPQGGGNGSSAPVSSPSSQVVGW